MSKYILSALITSAMFIAGVSGAYSLNKIKVQLKCDTVDLCQSSSKRLVLTANIGAVTASDSILGYNFSIKYDPKKIDFQVFSIIGSLSEVFDKYACNFKVMTVDSVKGDTSYSIRGWATNFHDLPAVGDKALFALAGDFKSTVVDSSAIVLEYIDFSPFRKVDFDTVYGYIANMYNPSRFLNLNTSSEVVKFEAGKDELKSFVISVNSGVIDKLQEAYFSLNLSDNINFAIESVKSTNKNNALVTKYGDNYLLKSDKFENDSNYIEVTLKKLTNDSAFAEVFIGVMATNSSSCISKVQGSSKFLNAKEKHVNVENDKDNELKIYDKNGNFDIVSINGISEIEIYDINGRIAYSGAGINSSSTSVNMTDKPSGVYIVRVVCENGKIVNKILIKN